MQNFVLFYFQFTDCKQIWVFSLKIVVTYPSYMLFIQRMFLLKLESLNFSILLSIFSLAHSSLNNPWETGVWWHGFLDPPPQHFFPFFHTNAAKNTAAENLEAIVCWYILDLVDKVPEKN